MSSSGSGLSAGGASIGPSTAGQGGAAGAGLETDSVRVKAVFLAAIGLRGGERARVLDAACEGDADLRAAVEALLELDGRPTCLDEPLTDASLAAMCGDSDEDSLGSLPGNIGPYLVTGVLGMGTSGVVYTARQLDPEREVAVKVLRVDAPLLRRRFERESQFLAALRHPGIAHVYERGIDPTSRMPYIAMELVPGARRITDHADWRGLDARGRAELVVQACDAMAHAHGAGVLHRDLKPANLLVDASGRVKIVDFGVGRWAASTGGGTMSGGLVGTMDYASPEQLRGEGGAAADVYSLGMVLYELLCGRTAFKGDGLNIFEAMRRMEAEEPTAPGVLNRACRGDLEAVVLKAIARPVGRRYGTAAQFGEDLRRALAGEAVSARRDSPLDAARRVVRKRPAASAALAALLLGSSAGGAFTWSQHERQLAAASAMTAAAVRALDYIETRSGSMPIRQVLLDTYLPVTEELVRAKPQDRDARYLLARLYDVKADIFYESRNFEPMLGLREQSFALMTALAQEDPASTTYAHRRSLAIVRLCDVKRDRGDLPAATKGYGEALAIQERLVEGGATDISLIDDLGWSYLRHANLRYVAGDREAALEFVAKQIAVANRLEALHPEAVQPFWSLVLAHGQAAEVLAGTDRREEFEMHLRASLKNAERLVQLKPGDRRSMAHYILRAMDVASRIEMPAGRIDAASELVSRVSACGEQLERFDPDSLDALIAGFELQRVRAKIQAERGDFEEAIRLARVALGIGERFRGAEPNGNGAEHRMSIAQELIRSYEAAVAAKVKPGG